MALDQCVERLRENFLRMDSGERARILFAAAARGSYTIDNPSFTHDLGLPFILCIVRRPRRAQPHPAIGMRAEARRPSRPIQAHLQRIAPSCQIGMRFANFHPCWGSTAARVTSRRSLLSSASAALESGNFASHSSWYG